MVAIGPSTIRYEAFPLAAGTEVISYEVQDRYPQARGVKITSSNVSEGRREARVTGRGEFDDFDR